MEVLVVSPELTILVDSVVPIEGRMVAAPVVSLMEAVVEDVVV